MHTYINFMILKDKIFVSNKALNSIDFTAQKMLDQIVINNQIGHPLTVTDAMFLSTLGSPATLHRKLDNLRRAGLLEMIFKGNDRRTKYLIPTEITSNYFQLLDEILISMLNDNVN
jgi:DNA-binding MarR family transcriptional regulator